MADEAAIIADFLYAKLNVAAITAHVSTRIHDTDPPSKPITGQTVIFPCIVFQQQSPSDVLGIGGVRIFVRPLWLIKVIVDDTSRWEQAGAIFKVIDATLHNTSGTTADGSVYACVRENDAIRYSEPKTGGGYYRHRGGIYRIEARATTTP